MQCDQILSHWLIIILSSYLVFGEILSLLWQICQGIGQFYIASNYQNRTCNLVTMAVGTCSIDCYTNLPPVPLGGFYYFTLLFRLFDNVYYCQLIHTYWL